MSSAVTSNRPPIAVVITVILLLFFFFGIFCVYFCRCFLASVMTNWHFRRSPSGAIVTGTTNATINPPPPTFGLHPDKIQALPAFKYSDVKDFRRHNYGLECAICLTEFRDNDLLRLLTTCCHVFHRDCIDLWFESHSTCPVCRSDLDVPHEETLITRSPILNNREGSYHHININDDDDDDDEVMMMKKRIIIGERPCLDNEEIRVVKFSRSNTTGHSLITRKEQDGQMIMGDDDHDQKDKYRLRLRDNVKINIIRRHNYAVSCITFGDFSSSCTTTTSDCSNMNGSAGSGSMGDQLSASSSSETSSSSLIKAADRNRIDAVVG